MPDAVNFVHLSTGKFALAELIGCAELPVAQVNEIRITWHPSPGYT